MPDEFPYDVFLNHNYVDQPRVRRLAERLWVGLEKSRMLLQCLSPRALASGWVALERSTAVHRDSANPGWRFIPLLLGYCALPDSLRRCIVVDFPGGIRGGGCRGTSWYGKLENSNG